jgi:hypothetical protein
MTNSGEFPDAGQAYARAMEDAAVRGVWVDARRPLTKESTIGCWDDTRRGGCCWRVRLTRRGSGLSWG